VPEKLITELFELLHNVTSGIVLTVVVGFTVIVKFSVCPTQVEPPVESVGVTETIEDNGVFELGFAEIKPGMSPAPLELRPIDVFPLTHVKVVFTALLPKTIGLVNELLHITKAGIGFTVGAGTT
jgi:hypothetical protein